MTDTNPPVVPDREAGRGRRWVCDNDPSRVEHTSFVGWTPCPSCRVIEPSPGDTVQAPDVAALRSALRRVADVLDFADDAIDPPITTEIDTNIVRMALLDTEDAPPAELRRQVRALLGTDTTPLAGRG